MKKRQIEAFKNWLFDKNISNLKNTNPDKKYLHEKHRKKLRTTNSAI
jgi:hypothetical protein